MKKTIKEFYDLIDRYSDLKNEDVILSTEYHDGIHYDICGYQETIFEIEESKDLDWLNEEIESLKKQVDAVSKLVDALKTIKYRYC